jgi:hypothetical protein
VIPTELFPPEFLDRIPEHIRARRDEAIRAMQATGRFTRSGFATTPPDILAEREATCRACPEWDAAALNSTGRCRKCGCSTWAKLRRATEACPIGKWKAVSAAPVNTRKPA